MIMTKMRSSSGVEYPIMAGLTKPVHGQKIELW
jgi:hypothetical protein